MMPLSLSCFSLCFTLAVASAAATTVTGTVDFSGGSPRSHSHPAHQSDIVVWLESEDTTLNQPHPANHAQMLQKDKSFRPHVLPIVAGTSVDFPNADPIFHNAFSNYDGQLFDVALYAPGTSRTVVFRRPGVVRVFCNIHPSMSAIIVVLKNSLYAMLDADNHFRIDDVPPGRYRLRYFDERATASQNETIELSVAESGNITAPTIHISEAGYVAPPHKNKYGQDYPHDADSYSRGIGPPK